MPELQREVCWKNTDGEKLMLASNLPTESWLLSDNEVSISLLVFDFWRVFFVPIRLFGVVYFTLWYCLAGFWVARYERKLSRGLSQPYFPWKIRILPFLACGKRWCAFLSCADEWVTSVRSHGKLAAELGRESLFRLRKCGRSLAIARSLRHDTL